MELQLRKITKRKPMNKKIGFMMVRNSYTELFFALAILFGIAIFFLILYNAYNDNIKDKLNTALTSSTDVDSNANVTKILDQTSTSLTRFDALFPLLIVGVFGFVLVMALMAKSHPAFLFIGIIILGVALILGAIYSNVYESIAETDNYEDTDTEFNITGLFLDNLPIIVIILFVAIAIILWVLPKGGTGGL